MNCWICGSVADSGEHMIKASDMRLFFPKVSQKNKILHTKDNGSISKSIGTVKSDVVHFSAEICKKCNNVRTSSHDKSWVKLSKYLYENKGLNKLYFTDVWGETYKANMINVHLYFAKLLGCAVESSKVEGQQIPLLTDSFSHSILENTPHPNLLLSFHYTEHHEYPALSDLQAHINPENGEVTYCFFFYILGPYAIKVAYSNFDCLYKGMLDAWHRDHNDLNIRSVKLLPFT
jgi:hypothetical protein